MNPIRIGIDFDGVIVDHRTHKLRLAEEFGVALEPWQTNTNLLRSYMPDEATYERLQAPLYGDMTVDAPPVPGALEGLKRLPGEVFVISARRPATVASARAWMLKNGLYDIVPEERVIFCESGKDKQTHCERLGISMFLDDKLSYLGHLNESLSRVLFDDDGIAHRLTLPPDIRVACDWEIFLDIAWESAKQPA